MGSFTERLGELLGAVEARAERDLRSVEPFPLFRYLDERVFTYNKRELSDLGRFAERSRRSAADVRGVDREGL